MSDLACLGGWDFEPDALPEFRDRLQQRRTYVEAVRRLAANMVRDAESDPARAAMLRDAGRTVTGLSAAHLGLSGAVTLPRLKALMAGFGLTSPGRVRALLSHMLHLRFVEPDPAAPDARPARYRLTERFLAAYTAHERSLVEAVAAVEPGAKALLGQLGRREVLATLVAEQTDAFIRTSRLPNPHGAWFGVFMHRHGGIQMVHALVAEAEGFPPAGVLPLSASAISRKFAVSRMHVSRMLRAAESAGYVELIEGGLRFTASGQTALKWVYSGRLCVHLRSVARTVRTHRGLFKNVRPASIEAQQAHS